MRRPRTRNRDPFAGDIGPEEVVRKAEAYALDLLARRPRTVAEMRMRLVGKGYPQATIDDLVGRCIRLGYLDDHSFATYWVEGRCQSYPCGPSRLRLELGQKGLNAGTIASVLAAVLPREREIALAVELGRKRASSLGRDGRSVPVWEESDPAGGLLASGNAFVSRSVRAKLWDFLRRRGFGTDACQEALRAALGPGDDPSELDLGDTDEAPPTS
jgi:SOS response regulatory protein OraA/RecX